MLWRNRNNDHDLIYFISDKNIASDTYYQRKINSHIIYLLQDQTQFNILNFLPRTFIISTNTSSSRFNIELLTDTSSTILELHNQNSDNFEFSLGIDDDRNVLNKFERMYRGEKVIFTEEDLPTSKKITEILNIKNCVNYLKPESLKSNMTRFSCSIKDGVRIDPESLNIFLKQKKFQTFSIITKNKEYKCNKFGVLYSEVIRELLIKDPTLDQYEYEFDDGCDEFNIICKLFNFEKVEVNFSDVHSLKEISEDLQINSITSRINSIIDDYEKFSQTIEEQQNLVDTIEELFGWLYNIKKLTVETVKKSIIDSFWIKTEDDVHELAAFILQVVKTDFLSHHFIADLLVLLDKEKNESNELKLLAPFIVDKLIESFGKSLCNCSFIYNMYKKGFIQEEDLFSYLKKYYNFSENKNFYEIKRNLISWFLPELIEIGLFNINGLPKIYRSKYVDSDDSSCDDEDDAKNLNDYWTTFILYYYPDRMDKYLIMRDQGEPDDEITKSLIHDDVDTFQSMVSKRETNFSINKVPFNIFVDFIQNDESNYINYASAFGSIKCFKYLILNHAPIENETFKFAVFGGNVEIIKIIDQKNDSSFYSNKKKAPLRNGYSIKSFNNNNKNSNGIVASITRHRNDLFDWIFEQKYSNKDEIEKNLSEFYLTSSKTGNAHSIIEIVNKGCSLIDYYQVCMEKASKNGFYRLSQLIFNIYSKNNDDENSEYHGIRPPNTEKLHFVSFGNLSIFELSLQLPNTAEVLEKSFLYAIKKGYKNIVHFYFENILKKTLKLNYNCIFAALSNSLHLKSNELFEYLMDQLVLIYPSLFHEFDDLDELLITACKNQKVDEVKKLTDLILENNPKGDFMMQFYEAASINSIEICRYFIDKKVVINYEKLASYAFRLGNVCVDIFSIMIENSSEEVKDRLLRSYLYPAISKHNKELVEYLIKNGSPFDDTLISAVGANDFDIVEIILKYNSKPSFVNKRTTYGTALHIAVSKNNLNIVKRLLEIPGIDPNLVDKNGKTALVLSVSNLNIELMNLILDFYGDRIQTQRYQLDEILKTALDMIPGNIKGHQTGCWSAKRTYRKDDKIIPILNRILEIKNIDPNCRGSQYTVLSYACEINEINIVQKLLQSEIIDVNAYTANKGNTPLMIAIENTNIEIATLLINDERTNINLRNYDNQTALTMAAKNQLVSIIDMLIKNEKFDAEESCLNRAFIESIDLISTQLYSVESLDVNYIVIEDKNSVSLRGDACQSYYYSKRNQNYETSLTIAVNKSNKKMVDLIINHPSFDKIKSQFEKAVFISVEKNSIEIFKKLINTSNFDVNIFSNSSNSLLSTAVSNKCKEIVKLILNNPTFDSRKSDILNAFIQGSLIINSRMPKNAIYMNNIPNEYRQYVYGNEEVDKNDDDDKDGMFDILNELIEFDSKHDHLIEFNKLLPNGCTFFTLKKNSILIEKYVKFFLDNGTDPNVPDKNGFYPLEHAILMNSEKFVFALINSNKIDFSAKIQSKNLISKNNSEFILFDQDDCSQPKYKTYLHLAAQSQKLEILEIFLTKKLIDVNVVDDNGDTPLIYACRSNRTNNIKLLFEVDDLDYLHVNKNGDDALKIIKYLSDNETYEQPKDKETYLKELLTFLYIHNESNDDYNGSDNRGNNYGEYAPYSSDYIIDDDD